MLPVPLGSVYSLRMKSEMGSILFQNIFSIQMSLKGRKIKKYFKEGLFKNTIFSLKKCDYLHMFCIQCSSKIHVAHAGKGDILSVYLKKH